MIKCMKKVTHCFLKKLEVTDHVIFIKCFRH